MMKPLATFVPRTPAGDIDWNYLSRTYPFWDALAETPQCATHHAEGNVLRHTMMVAEEAEKLAVEHGLSPDDTDLLVGGAVFHDVGKAPTLTFDESGVPSSPQHAAVGTRMLRHFWWERGWYPHDRRELLLSLVRFHAAPVRLLDNKHDPNVRVIETSWLSRNDLLSLLAQADMRGRICSDASAQARAIETAQMFGDFARELGCYAVPRPFPSSLARFHYFSTAGRSGPLYDPFDSSTGEAVLMCGLPGSGKNTWVEKNASGDPVIELDAIRREMNVSPEDNQGEVVQAAKERARELMRRKTSRFIWNATNVRADLRRPLISLFTEYGYKVTIVYCPGDRPELLLRNQRRRDDTRVPSEVIDRLGFKLEPPRVTEAHDVRTFLPDL